MNAQASSSRAAAGSRARTKPPTGRVTAGRAAASRGTASRAAASRATVGRGAGRRAALGRPAASRVTASQRTAATSPAGSKRGETPKARGERTRGRVADALVSLLEGGDPAPTAKAVAAEAGVSVRLVFHHFEDMESLYRTVMALQAAQYWDAVEAVPADRPLEDRIDLVVGQRAKLFESVSAVRRAGMNLAPRQPDIAEWIADADGRLRGWLEETFGPELRYAGRERRELLSALDTAASWEAWDRMRRAEHLSVAAARRVTGRMLRSLLG